MPINVELLGYKQFSNQEKALCYNCKRKKGCKGLECNMCCEEQKNKKLYPNLKSPDYVFSKDVKERLEHKDILKENKLNPISILV